MRISIRILMEALCSPPDVVVTFYSPHGTFHSSILCLLQEIRSFTFTLKLNAVAYVKARKYRVKLTTLLKTLIRFGQRKPFYDCVRHVIFLVLKLKKGRENGSLLYRAIFKNFALSYSARSDLSIVQGLKFFCDIWGVL